MAGKFQNWLDNHLNNLKIKKKLFLLYLYCMILPLVLTDGSDYWIDYQERI